MRVGHILHLGTMNQGHERRTLLITSQPYALWSVPMISVSIRGKSKTMRDDAFMLIYPTLIPTSCNVLHLARDLSEHREFADERTPARNHASQRKQRERSLVNQFRWRDTKPLT